MTGKVAFLRQDVDEVLSARGVAAIETAQANNVAVSTKARRQTRALSNLQAMILLCEEAGLERVSASAQRSLRLATGFGASAAAVNLAEATIAGASAQEASSDATGVNMLESIGGMVIDYLDDGESERLRKAGFAIFENERVFFAPPLEAGAQAQVGWHIDACGASALHIAGVTGQGQCIGILDTGIDPTHPEFAGKQISFAEFDMMGRLAGTVARDSGDHGTHVAGIAAGRTAGVAKDADLAVAAVLTFIGPNGNEGYLGQIAGGFNWLTGKDLPGAPAPENLSVVNASLGSTGFLDYLYAPIRRARREGIPFVGSIGNSGRSGPDHHGSPGNYDISIGVGAYDRNNAIAVFSDWGTVADFNGLAKPDLCAPGVNIRSSLPGGGYGDMSGTSMAAPCVAGAVALLIQEYPQLAQDVDAIEAMLYTNKVVAMPGASAVRFGRGRLAL